MTISPLLNAIAGTWFVDKGKIILDGEDLSIIIGRRGETLDALQYLAGLAANNGGGHYKISINIGDYRERREETLIKFYLSAGYTPKMEEKKPGIKIKEMRKKLEAEAPDVLKAFNEAYDKKDDKKAFFNACKIYSDWEKAQKNQPEAEQTEE